MNKLQYKYTLLFIEDDNEIRKNYVDILSGTFENVFEASDGVEAYEIYLSKKPDILIIDVDLPKMNGLDLLKKIRLQDFNTKAILFTSHYDKETMLKASILKLTQYLIKPVNRKDLQTALLLAIKEIEKFNVLPKKTLLLRDGFYWNIERNELYKNNSIVKLTKKERDILKIIFANASIHKITTYDALLYPIWDESNELTLKSLKTFMTTIRKKLPEETIINEYSLGYKVIC